MCDGIVLSHKKEWNSAICNNMDGLGGRYAKWNAKERQIGIDGNILDNIPSTVPGANTVYTAQWEEIVVKTYKINYYLVKGGELYDSDSYKEGDEISFIIPAAKDIEGFDVRDFYVDLVADLKSKGF